MEPLAAAIAIASTFRHKPALNDVISQILGHFSYCGSFHAAVELNLKYDHQPYLHPTRWHRLFPRH
jgi:hypothetical protein